MLRNAVSIAVRLKPGFALPCVRRYSETAWKPNQRTYIRDLLDPYRAALKEKGDLVCALNAEKAPEAIKQRAIADLRKQERLLESKRRNIWNATEKLCYKFVKIKKRQMV